MLFDNAEEKTGLTKTCDLINKNVNAFLKEKTEGIALDLNNLKMIDELMLEFFKTQIAEEGAEIGAPGTAIIRACSEAMYFGASSCLDNRAGTVGMTIREHFSPQSGIEVPAKATKMLFTLFNAGRGSGSTVKFSKFYLIVDAKAF
jgi:hypothetical protein